MYKYSKTTNQFIQLPDVPSDVIDVTDDVVAQARAAVGQMLPFVVLDSDTITVAPSAKHHYEAEIGEWHYWPYAYSASENAFFPSDMLDAYELPDDVINVDVAVFDAASSARSSGLAFVVFGSTAISVAPSTAHDWNTKTNDWVLNKTRAAEAAAAQAQADASAKVALMTARVQAYLDTTAQGFGFDDIKSAALRASFTGSPLQPLGLKLGVWMDEVWLACKTLLADWQAGKIDEPTIDVVLAALPPAPTDAPADVEATGNA